MFGVEETRNLETQNCFALGPLGGVLWAFQIFVFLAYLQFLNDHILAWFWYQKSSLGMNFLKNYMQFFFCPNNAFFGQKRAILGTRNPYYDEIWNFDPPISFSHQIYVRINKKTLAIDLYEGAIDFQSLYVWPILAIFGHISTPDSLWGGY